MIHACEDEKFETDSEKRPDNKRRRWWIEMIRSDKNGMLRDTQSQDDKAWLRRGNGDEKVLSHCTQTVGSHGVKPEHHGSFDENTFLCILLLLLLKLRVSVKENERQPRRRLTLEKHKATRVFGIQRSKMYILGSWVIKSKSFLD